MLFDDPIYKPYPSSFPLAEELQKREQVQEVMNFWEWARKSL